MTPTTDIEELEGPFEQIAGAPASPSYGSSGSATITLEIDGKTDATLDYGKIDLSRMTQQPVFQEKIDRLRELKAKIESKQASGITPADAPELTDLYNQVKQLIDEIQNISLELTKASGQNTPDAVKITIRTTSGNSYFEFIVQAPVDVHARPGNPTDSLGILSSGGGYTDDNGEKIVSFIPNGNYGTISFKAKRDSVTSNIVTLQIKGEFKEDAQERLDDEIEKLTQDASDTLALAAGLLTLAVAVVALATKNAFATLVAAAVAALVGLLILVTVVANVRKKIKKMKKNNKAKIENLPSRQ